MRSLVQLRNELEILLRKKSKRGRRINASIEYRVMDIKVYIHDNKNMESSTKIFDLLKKCELKFAVEVFGYFKSDDKEYIANVVGEKVKKLPPCSN